MTDFIEKGLYNNFEYNLFLKTWHFLIKILSFAAYY